MEENKNNKNEEELQKNDSGKDADSTNVVQSDQAAKASEAAKQSSAPQTQQTADTSQGQAAASAPQAAPAPQQEEKKKSNRKFIIIIILLLIVFGVILYFGYQFFMAKLREANEKDMHGMVIDREGGQYVLRDDEENLPGIAIPGQTKITFAPGETEVSGNIDFYNPEKNEGWYYLTFQLLVDINHDGNYEEIYQSDLVEPGKHIQKITISKPLEKGQYNAVVHVQPYLMSDMAAVNNSNMETTLVVE